MAARLRGASWAARTGTALSRPLAPPPPPSLPSPPAGVAPPSPQPLQKSSPPRVRFQAHLGGRRRRVRKSRSGEGVDGAFCVRCAADEPRMTAGSPAPETRGAEPARARAGDRREPRDRKGFGTAIGNGRRRARMRPDADRPDMNPPMRARDRGHGRPWASGMGAAGPRVRDGARGKGTRRKGEAARGAGGSCTGSATLHCAPPRARREAPKHVCRSRIERAPESPRARTASTPRA